MSKHDYLKEQDGCAVRVEQDEMSCNPRTEWDNVAVFVCSHRRYVLGDKHNYNHADYNSWFEMKKAILKKEKPVIIKDLYMLDHSGITISTSTEGFRAVDSHGWDWGQVGLVFVRGDHPELKGLRGKKKAERAEAIIDSEVAAYDQYLRGDVWCYTISTPDDDHADSLCGMFGHEYAEKEALEAFENFMADRAKPAAGAIENTNCLTGFKCPKCGRAEKFTIACSCVCDVTDDGTADERQIEWTPSSFCKCADCGHAGTVGDFCKDEED